MDQRQAQTDGDRREALWRALVRRTENDDQQKEGQHHLRDQAGQHGVFARRAVAVTVGGKTGGRGESRLAARDVGEDVRKQFRAAEPPAHTKADEDGGFEVAAGNVPDDVGHGEHGQAKGQRHPPGRCRG